MAGKNGGTGKASRLRHHATLARASRGLEQEDAGSRVLRQQNRSRAMLRMNDRLQESEQGDAARIAAENALFDRTMDMIKRTVRPR